MITFATVLYEGIDVPDFSRGYYGPEWADKLARGLARHVQDAYRFVCYVDRPYLFAEPVEQRLIKRYRHDMRALLEPFGDDLGRVIFMGLDTLVVGSLDRLLAYSGSFGMARDPCNETKACSGVMSFTHRPDIWERYVETDAKGSMLGGFPSDMDFLRGFKPDILDGCGLYSAPIHCRGGFPDDAAIVFFHGRMKPHNTIAPWVQENWQ